MSLIWDHFPHGGADLLLALALADWANHDGNGIWPSVKTIARKTRQSERAVQYQLKRMKAAGWLEQVEAGGGRAKSTTYRIPLELIPQGAEGPVQNLHPFKRVQPDAERVQMDAGNGATAVAPDPLLTVKEPVNRRRGAPSPVALGFAAYQQGIKAKYNAEYPRSAKANGQLANVVGRVGQDLTVPVVAWYLAHQDPFYARTKHSLDYLVRDCEKFSLELQAAAGAGNAALAAPTHARVALLKADGAVARELPEVPAGDMLAIAKAAAKSYSGMIASIKPKYLGVRQGTERRRFSIEELSP